MIGSRNRVCIVGGGLAGSEAAYSLARMGIGVTLFEMRPKNCSPAHTTDKLGELICSNSLGSISHPHASLLLKEEMKILGSLVIMAAEATRVPAGRSLSVDRDLFSGFITERITENPLIEVIREEVSDLPDFEIVLIASGPLTSEKFLSSLRLLTGEEALYFYDAVSPIVEGASINFAKTFWGSRYEDGPGDYLNIPLSREQYYRFVAELKSAHQIPVKELDTERFFEGCLPIEEMAKRGDDTLAFGPMKPVGFPLRKVGDDFFALVQLRSENESRSMFNLVGFQTRMTFAEQKRVFSSLPGLENANFHRLGKMHKNTYVNSRKILNNDLTIRNHRNIYMAGQLSGVEGYLESSLTGLIASLYISAQLSGRDIEPCPVATMSGSLLDYITNPRYDSNNLQPINANYGILNQHIDFGGIKKSQHKVFAFKHALENITGWYSNYFKKP